MGKLIKDLPASPVHYLVTLLQEKEKKVKQIVRDTTSPIKEKRIEVSDNAKLWATAPVTPARKATTSMGVATFPAQDTQAENRNYEKPWLSRSKKSPGKQKPGSKFDLTAPTSDGSGAKPTKSEWSQKTKLTADKRSDAVDGDDGVDLGLVYAKPKIVGDPHVRIKNDTEEMESELKMSGKQREKDPMSDVSNKKSTSKISAKEAKRRRLEELRRITEQNDKKKSKDAKVPIRKLDESDDDALELLEDANDLISEGVKNPPKSGFMVNTSSKKAKEEIELVLNMSKFFDELGGMEGVSQSGIAGKNSSQLGLEEDDEDFESASQVTGPRRPVWEAPESEVESTASQIRSARRSGIGVQDFDIRPDSAKGESSKKVSNEPKADKRKAKTPESRPRTAPSRTSSRGDLKTSNNNGRETYRVDDPKASKSPRSRPTTPRGSVVGRTSRRASQASNHSAVSSPGKKTTDTKDLEKKKSMRADDEPDSGSKKSP